MRIRNRLAALGITAALALSASATVGHAVTDPLPIEPNVAFSGLVNGAQANAVVKVVCPGPVVIGETGHPAAGQYLEVVTTPVTSTDSGFTGSLGHSIDAYLVTPTGAATGPVVVFNSFYVEEPIPTTILLPCSGPGSATFVPEPTSPTARAAVVSVIFQNIGV